MPTNFDCVGFRVESGEELYELAKRLLPNSEHLGRGSRGLDAYRWQDSSGARLVFDVKRNTVRNALPSFAGGSATQVRYVTRLNDDTSGADVVDDAGETVTRLAVDVEQRALLPGANVRGTAFLVGLVGHIETFPDAETFANAPASLLGDPNDAGPPPDHFVEQGWLWPPRMGAESFVSQGMFVPAREAARPIASLNGVVLDADQRVNSLTGLTFVRSRVRTAGFEADVCWPTGESEVPNAGQVLSATVYMVGSLDDWTVEDVDKPGWRHALSRRLGRREN